MLEERCNLGGGNDDLLNDDDDFNEFMERRITITSFNRKVTFKRKTTKKSFIH